MKVLVCSAHPDDETLGAGGTILRWAAEGHDLFWCIFTKPWEPFWTADYAKVAHRQSEQAAERLGFSDVYRLENKAARLDVEPQQEINDRFGRVVRQVAPHTILTVWGGDVHADHRAVAEAVMVASRPQPGNPVKRVMAYETCSSSEWGSEPFPATVYVDITDTLDAKLHALAAYETEAKQAPHPRSPEGVRARAVLRGFEVGLPAAEAFHLIRDIS